MASFSTFSDPLLISTQNTTLWGGNFGTLSWSGGGFTVTNGISYTGYGGQTTNSGYDLTGTACFCSVANVGNQSLASCETVPLQLNDAGGTNKLFWYVNGGNLLAIKTIAGVQATVATTTYNSSVHKWFRIRESGGTIFWDYSTDGVTYTNFTSIINVLTITALFLQVSLGTYSSEASATTAKWNSFNTAPSTVNKGAAFLTMM